MTSFWERGKRHVKQFGMVLSQWLQDGSEKKHNNMGFRPVKGLLKSIFFTNIKTTIIFPFDR